MTTRELCDEVASKVMGWRHHKGANGHEYHTYKDGRQTVCDRLYLTWDDAGRVMERLCALGYVVGLVVTPQYVLDAYLKSNGPDPAAKKFCCQVYRDGEYMFAVYASSEDGPRAVFEASLKIMEGHNVG